MTLNRYRHVWVLPSLLLILSLVAIGSPGVGAQATPVPVPGTQYTPLLPAVLSTPRWFRGADEQIHLVYELLLTNAFPVSVEVTTVEDGQLVMAYERGTFRSKSRPLSNTA